MTLALLLVATAAPCLADSPHLAFAARVAGDAQRTRIVMDFDTKPDVSVHYVASPMRIVIDFPNAELAVPDKALEPRGLFKSIRYGAMGPTSARMVLTTTEPARIDLNKVVPNDQGPGYRLILDAKAVSSQAFSALVKSKSWLDDDSSALRKAAAAPDGAFTVVVDAGHGGIDSGAVGVTGTLEKNVTLAFAKKLATDLRGADVNVVMTRDDDTFVSLEDRVKTGEEANANLFVSIHANTYSTKSIRGATVYTLSDKASDRVSQRIAEDENRADAVAGLPPAKAPKGVADILLDLTRRETQAFSARFANHLVTSFDGEVRLIGNPHRYAAFQVLKATDVPSVLIELGYLSNPDDERLLNDPKWQTKVAGLVTKSVLSYRSRSLASRN